MVRLEGAHRRYSTHVGSQPQVSIGVDRRLEIVQAMLDPDQLLQPAVRSCGAGGCAARRLGCGGSGGEHALPQAARLQHVCHTARHPVALSCADHKGVRALLIPILLQAQVPSRERGGEMPSRAPLVRSSSRQYPQPRVGAHNCPPAGDPAPPHPPPPPASPRSGAAGTTCRAAWHAAGALSAPTCHC